MADWLAAGATWTPTPGPRHAELLGALVERHDVRGSLLPDAQLAALALEHGLTVCSADTDVARFTEVRWENPWRPGRPLARQPCLRCLRWCLKV